MDIQMRIRLDQYQELRHLLIHDTSVEQGCFLLCSEIHGDDSIKLLVNHIVALDKTDFAMQKSDFLSVKPEAILKTVRLAQKHDYSICFIHTHPMSEGHVEFSLADDHGNERTFEFINRLLPNKLNTALVFDRIMSTVSGRAYFVYDKWEVISSITVPGSPYLLEASVNGCSHDDYQINRIFDRQALLLGEKGQKQLARQKVVFVGMGGIGSLGSLFLAHSGFKHITLIDPDIIEGSNRPRIPASTPTHVSNKALKVDINGELLKSSWPDCTVKTISESTESCDVLSHLIDADLIVCGTDNAHSRAYLNEICHRYYVPLLDLGVEFTSEDGELINEVGKVNFVMPGTACLWCIGYVTSELLAAEELPADESKKRAAEGYIRNTHVPQPSMMAYNGEVVARGIQHVIQQLTGLAPIDCSTYEQFSFIGLNKRAHHRVVKKRQIESCPFCASTGSVLGNGNTSINLIKPAA